VSIRNSSDIAGGRLLRMSRSECSRRAVASDITVRGVGDPNPDPASDGSGRTNLGGRSRVGAEEPRGVGVGADVLVERGPISLLTTPQTRRCSGRVAIRAPPTQPRGPRWCRRCERDPAWSVADEHRGARLLDRALKTLAQRHLRRPAEQLLSQRDVRPALLGIVDRQRLVHDLRARSRQLLHGLRQFEQRELIGIADVHRVVMPGLRQRDDAADEVADVAERARLAAIAEHRQRSVRERLAQERRDRAAVVRTHARAVGVEDPHDRRVHALLAVVGHRQRLRVALGLVVDPARADRVDVAPVALRLRVLQRIAVHLARRRDQEARAMRLRQTERVVRAV
jgi:hypothetical protein